MNNADFWASIHDIITTGFTPEGLQILDTYAEQFITGQLVYQRFSPQEQHGCAAGGYANVIATLLAGAEDCTNPSHQPALNNFQAECQRATRQSSIIEHWARVVDLWLDCVDDLLSRNLGKMIAEGGEAQVYDHGSSLIKTIGLDYFIQPILALDRISLHNTYFPETRLSVIGFGRNRQGDFKIIVEQPFIVGSPVTDDEIALHMRQLGFTLQNPRNWTYTTPDIYLSDVHDENVIRSDKSGHLFVIDCDIRINTPQLKQGGRRSLTTEVYFND